MSTVRKTVASSASPLVRGSHIVPRFYLNKFADAQKFLFQFVPGRDAQRTSTKSLTTEEDFFEYTVNGHATVNRYENWFQRIETDAGAMYPTLHAGEALTGEQEIIWSLFVGTIFLRSRKVREQLGPALTKMMDEEKYDSEENIREMQHELLKGGVLMHSEDMRAKVRQILEEMRVPAFGQLAGIEDSAKTIAKNIVAKKRWFILEAAPGHEFVTSDCPVQTWALNTPKAPITMGTGFSHQNTAIVFPMSPSRLFFANNSICWPSRLLSPDDTVKFNTATVKFAHRAVFGLSKRAEIQVLVESELNRCTFGENCFIPKVLGLRRPSVASSGAL